LTNRKTSCKESRHVTETGYGVLIRNNEHKVQKQYASRKRDGDQERNDKRVGKIPRGDLQIEIVQSTEYARRKREKLDWKVMLEKAIEREMIQGMPQGDKETTQREVTTQSRNQLVSHRTGTSQITWETTPQRKR
jgi:hypothetical protein